MTLRRRLLVVAALLLFALVICSPLLYRCGGRLGWYSTNVYDGTGGAGVHFEIQGDDTFHRIDVGEFTTLKTTWNKVNIFGSRVKVNGKDYGTVEPGDKLLVDFRGQVFVNGEPR